MPLEHIMWITDCAIKVALILGLAWVMGKVLDNLED